MRIEPLNDKVIRDKYLGSRFTSVKDVARTAQADALRQVINEVTRVKSEDKQETNMGLWKLFQSLQSALVEMEREAR